MALTLLDPDHLAFDDYLDVNIFASGLPRLAERLRTRSCTIGYAGGSNSVTTKGWRGYFHDWLDRTHAEHGPHRAISAAVGAIHGTGGCFIAPRYFGDETFDLIFIEYTGNDQNRVEYGEMDADHVRVGIESMIRLFRRRYPEADLCIISVVSLDTTRDGPKDTSSAVYDRAGEAYGVPVINASEFARRLHAEGVDVAPIYLPDHYHLTEIGRRSFGDFINASVTRFMESDAGEQPRVLPEGSDLLESPSIPSFTADMVPPGTARDRFTSRIFPEGEQYWKLGPGDTLRFTLDGTLHGLFVIVHPTVGCIDIGTDDDRHTVSLFDRWCTNPPKPRIKVMNLDRPIVSSGGRVTAFLLDHVPDHLPRLAASRPPEAPPEDWAFDIIGAMVDGSIRP